MRLPKEAEGRRVDILLQNIPTLNVKITKVTDDEILAAHEDNEEVHINPNFIMCWWPSTKKEMSEKQREALRKARASRDKL